jgi:hypothetical protein
VLKWAQKEFSKKITLFTQKSISLTFGQTASGGFKATISIIFN